MNAFRCIVPAVLAAAAVFGQTPRLEFEVASIHPADQSNPAQVNVGVHIDGAQVNITYFALKDYIRVAYKLKDYQIVGPDWIASQRFDISAKLPSGATREQVADMLKSLIEDRFKIKSHMDSKEFPVYALVAAKGGIKLKESPVDPDTATAPGAPAPNVNVAVSGGARGVTINLGRGAYFAFADNKLEAKKLTMQAFCDTLARFMDKPVIDMTDLKGTYDITLNFTPEDYTAMLIHSAISAGVTLPPQALKALELSSGDSLASALQLVGLKLDSRKAPLPVLVVDKIEKNPTEN
jgi:uncharacterized protein (TIGR03435 family)